MSGIAGAFYKEAHNQTERMLGKIAHRGPDGRDLKDVPGKATLGHARLITLDPLDGHQPMGFGHTWITFDGQIYNYRELAAQHLAGQPLLTLSDTEVILKLYQIFGTHCAELLDGMFAFAIVTGDGLFMARDPLGIRPLYYGERNGTLFFASEIKSLATTLDEVREFPPGHWYHSKLGWHAYYQLRPAPLDMAQEAKSLEAIRTTVKEAVWKRLFADVPVGIDIAGGLHGSIIALHASEIAPGLHSFAVGMQGSEALDSAHKMAALLGTQHHERIYTEQEALAALPRLVYHLESCDPALVRSAIRDYFLAELAAKHVKVLLTAEGADELYNPPDHSYSYQGSKPLQDEMIKKMAVLHNTALQRLDRIMMAFGLQARVPFLDLDSVAVGLGLSARPGVPREEPVPSLVRAYSADLPQEILNRSIHMFGQGAVPSDFISRNVAHHISNQDFYSERDRLLYQWGYRLAGKEGLYCYRLLRQHYQDEWIFPSIGVGGSV